MMDVDEHRAGAGGGHREQRVDKLLVKDEHYSITERKNLPLDVRRVVEASGQFEVLPFEIRQLLTGMHSCTDPYTRPVKGTLDPITGFGLLVSSEWCYVWNAASVSLSPSSLKNGLFR